MDLSRDSGNVSLVGVEGDGVMESNLAPVTVGIAKRDSMVAVQFVNRPTIVTPLLKDTSDAAKLRRKKDYGGCSIRRIFCYHLLDDATVWSPCHGLSK